VKSPFEKGHGVLVNHLIHVQRAVNRGESYHQLRRTISYANYGKLRFGTEYEQHLWSECSRLIANCIIFYNATLLSKLP